MKIEYNEHLLFLPYQREIAERIMKIYLATSCHHRFDKYIFSIAGTSGSGKTEVANILAQLFLEKLNYTSKICSQDAYYKTTSENRERERKRTDIIGKEELDWSAIKKQVCKFHLSNCPIFIFEGLYSCYLSEADFKIYLEASDEETYEFRKVRKKENPDDGFRKYVLEKERICVEKSKEFSDLIYNIKDFM